LDELLHPTSRLGLRFDFLAAQAGNAGGAGGGAGGGSGGAGALGGSGVASGRGEQAGGQVPVAISALGLLRAGGGSGEGEGGFGASASGGGGWESDQVRPPVDPRDAPLAVKPFFF